MQSLKTLLKIKELSEKESESFAQNDRLREAAK